MRWRDSAIALSEFNGGDFLPKGFELPAGVRGYVVVNDFWIYVQVREDGQYRLFEERWDWNFRNPQVKKENIWDIPIVVGGSRVSDDF